MKLPIKKISFLFVILSSFFLNPLFISAQESSQTSSELPENFLLRDSFFLSPNQKIQFNTYESNGFLLIKESRPELNSDYAVITGFDGPILETRALRDVKTIDQANELLKRSVKIVNYEGVTIKEIPLMTRDNVEVSNYWIGQRSFSSLELAQASVVSTKTAVETNGGNFSRAIELIEEFSPEEPQAQTAEEIKANYQREEEIAIKMMDWLDIGEKAWGPFHTPGAVSGEPLLWQSFGDTSFRFTNLEADEYYAQTGFWTNRFVVKGLRGPGDTTFDPYVEVTPSLETNGVNYKSNLILVGGVQWYPLIRNATLQNSMPLGLPLTDFIRNYRLFAQYMIRENIKDEILGSKNHDVRAGVDIFHEWGLGLDPIGIKPERTKLIQYIRDYIWGEYFGTYHWEKTNFSSIKNYNSFLMNTSLILGYDGPTIPLPRNPWNDHLTLMPYMKFEHVSNANHSLHYQNQYLVSAGLRVMPFRAYQYAENEWLFKTKLYFEYVGIGGAIWPSANTPIDTPNRDIRFGVNVSHKRY